MYSDHRQIMINTRTSTKKGVHFIFCIDLLQMLWVSDQFFLNYSILNRHSVNKPGNGAGRVKRVLSCKKKKTHQLTVARRKQHLPGRNFDSTHKENETKRMQDKQQETFFNDPSEFPLNVSDRYKTSETGSERFDFHTLIDVTVIVQTFLCHDYCCMKLSEHLVLCFS